MTRYIPFSTVIGALLLGCASSPPSANPTTPQHPHGVSAHPHQPGAGLHGGCSHGSCPMQIEGTTVVAQDVEAGAALVFETTSDVDELRRRVAGMAEKHAAHDMNCMPGMKGHAQCQQHAMPASEARMEPTDGGARLVFTPKDLSQLAALREHVARHAGHMSDGKCHMMEGAP